MTERLRNLTRTAWFAPLVVGILGVAAAAYGTWRPSFWYDEAATVSATDRSLRQIGGLVEHTDLVHAAYYFVMHTWTSVFGYSEFALRFPSALAVGAAGAALVVLGERLCDRRFGIVVGVVLVAMPRTMWAGSEARSYAGTLLLAVLFTLALLIALDRGRWWWAAYAALGVATAIWFFLSVTVILAHVVIVVILRRQSRVQDRIPLGFWCAAAGIAAVVLPFGWAAFRQREQVSWIPPMSADTLASYSLFEIPDGSVVYLVVAALVLVCGVAAAALAGVTAGWQVLFVGLAWWLVPTVVVLAYSWLATPTYTPRYLIVALPGVALALGWSVLQLARGRLWLVVTITGLLVAVTIPHYLGQRAPYGRFGGTDFSQVADYIGDHARPGDCVAFAEQPTWSPVSMRVVRAAKPADFVGLRDVGPRRPAASSDMLWDTDRPVTAYTEFARTCGVIWVVTDAERDRRSDLLPGGTTYWRFEPYHFTSTPLYRELSGAGLHLAGRTQFNNSQVIEMRR